MKSNHDPMTQAIQDAYHRLAFHEQRLDRAVGWRGHQRIMLTVVSPIETPPLHHLRQILDLIAHRTSECETQLSQWDEQTPLKEILALAQGIRRTHRQTERAWTMLEHAQAQMPAAWRSQARLYRRMLTHQRQRLNAVRVRVEDFSLQAQRALRQERMKPVVVVSAPSKKRPSPHVLTLLLSQGAAWSFTFAGRARSWLTHPLVDVRLTSPIE